MVAEIIPPTKTSGARPPFLPPTITTFSNDPDEDGRQDTLVFIRDSVERLIRASRELDPDSIFIYLALLEQRRDWILGEMMTERLLAVDPKPPLGIEEDPYDLSALTYEFREPRARQFRAMLDLIDETHARLASQLPDQKHDS